MAYYAALASLVQLLHDIILGDGYPPTFPLGKHHVVKSLRQKFALLLEESLQDYSSKGDKVNARVEGRIRDAAYRAQDIIELDILNRVTLQERNFSSRNRTGVMKKIQLYRDKRSEKKCVKKLHKVEKEIDLVVEEIKSIKEQRRSEGLRLDWDASYPSVSEEAPSTADNIMVGFDEDLTVIKDKLCGHSSKLQVIPIVGMGGIGKTTLARHTFDDALVKYHFDCRAWVAVSQDFNMKRVLHGIIRSLAKSISSLKPDELLDDDLEFKETIYKCLKGRRYLIVVDDVWDTKFWNDAMKWICPNDGNGSRIILRTRLLDVAQYTSNPAFIHEMKFLNEHHSWSLLQQKVFAKESCPPKLKDIGNFIVSKCCGLPLAIVVVAGILSGDKTPENWKKIAANVTTILGKTDDHISSILSLSYHHLPHQLKAYFLYMGRFPEDYEIKVSDLIRLWVAEGFLQPTQRSKILEDVAEECLQDLVKRNLVLITGKRPNGRSKFCSMHDLLKDFCKQRAFNEYFFHEEYKRGLLYPQGNKMIRSINFSPEHSRFCYEWENIKLLRVLNSIDECCVTDTIFQLFYLRYLSFHSPYRPFVLLSICMLPYLQTLIIHTYTRHTLYLPPQIWMMVHLRHVVVPQAFLPSISTASGNHVQKLECLQTLGKVLNWEFTKEAIEMIPNLRKLKIILVEDESSISRLKNLVHLKQLEELKIEFSYSDRVYSKHLLTSIAFPSNLKKLSLDYCELLWEVLTVVGSLPNLQALKLGTSSFVGEEWEPTHGEFTQLKFLLLSCLNLKFWLAENSHFPCLEYLVISGCNNM